MLTKIRTLVIDANRLFREGLKSLLADTPFDITGEAANVDEALELFGHETGVDLVIADLDMEDQAASDCLRSLTDSLEPPRIVVLTSELSVGRLTESLKNGADAYLLKEISAEALEKSLGLVMVGEKVFPTYLAKLLISGRFPSNERHIDEQTNSSAELSDRENQVLERIVHGEPNKVIARELEISEATVKVHLKSLLKKIHVANRTQAAVWALKYGMIKDATANCLRDAHKTKRDLVLPCPETRIAN